MRYIAPILLCFFCACSTNKTTVKTTQVEQTQKSAIKPEFKALVHEFALLRKYPPTEIKIQPTSIKEYKENIQKRLSELDRTVRGLKKRFEAFIKLNRHPESLLSIVYIASLYQYYHDQLEKIPAPVSFDETMKKQFTSKMKEMAKTLFIKSQKTLAIFTKKCEPLKGKEYCEGLIQNTTYQRSTLQN